MHLYYRNINDAFTNICRGFRDGRFQSSPNSNIVVETPPISKGSSRYGTVLRIEEPVTITYTNPLERVLFNENRNCNPFFHLIEALWMLAGNNQVKYLTNFVKRMAEFCDEDLMESDVPYRGEFQKYTSNIHGVMWGAYGYRWRNWFKRDQLEQCIQTLIRDRNSRRVVLTMWEPEDLNRVLTKPACKDVPCNLLVMFSPRPSTDTHRLHEGQAMLSPKERRLVKSSSTREMKPANDSQQYDDQASGCTLLDMTVINRSNDTIWGALGSNYVHFSFLHEYVANAVGMGVGYYHQISNNLHIYTNQTDACQTQPKWSGQWEPDELCLDSPDPYLQGYAHYPLFRCPINCQETTDLKRAIFDAVCTQLFSNDKVIATPRPTGPDEEYGFIPDVVLPMIRAWKAHKEKEYDSAIQHSHSIIPTDWRLNCQQWLRRAAARYYKASASGVIHG